MEGTGSLLVSRVSSLSFSCWVTSTPCYQRFEFDTKTMQRNSDRLFSNMKALCTYYVPMTVSRHWITGSSYATREKVVHVETNDIEDYPVNN